MASSFKSLLGKSTQDSQLKTKYFGLVTGMLKNYKGLLQSEKEEKREGAKNSSLKQEAQSKDDNFRKSAMKMGFYLMKKLKNNLRKYSRVKFYENLILWKRDKSEEKSPLMEEKKQRQSLFIRDDTISTPYIGLSKNNNNNSGAKVI